MKEVLNAHEVAELMHVNVETIRRQSRKGKIPHFKMGRKVFYYREALIEYMYGSKENYQKYHVVDKEKVENNIMDMERSDK